MTVWRASLYGFLINMLLVIVLFELRTVIRGDWYVGALVLVVGLAAWLAARWAASRHMLAGILSTTPLILYFVFVSALIFREFTLAHFAVIALLLGGALLGSALAPQRTAAIAKKESTPSGQTLS